MVAVTDRRRIAKLVLFAAVVIAAIVAIVVGVVFTIGLGPEADALTAIEASDVVTVERFDGGTVVSSGPITENTVGLVYYPGARVNAESYVPTAAEVVTGSDGEPNRDVAVVIVDMPLNLAVLAPGRADDGIESLPAVESWYVGGHSLGGAMACRYAAGNADRLEGLVLHASYCDDDLSGTDLRALSVLGSADGVIDAGAEREGRTLLPAEATILELDGVNHAGFGAYGPQRGDMSVSTDPSEMRGVVGNTTGEWLVGDAARVGG